MSTFQWRPDNLLKGLKAQLSNGYSLLRQSEDSETFNEDGLPTMSEKPKPPSRLSRLFWVMVPSYIAKQYGHQSDVKYSELNDTSYLNGLRGWAAAAVLVHHATGNR
jgi:hypothetical protein